MSAATTWWLTAILLTAPGVALATWSIRGDRARGRKRCPKCWYDMSGARSSEARCPECGRIVKHEKDWFRTRRRWHGVWIALSLLVLAVASGLVGKARRDGWESIAPTTVLILAAAWIDHPWPLEVLEDRVDAMAADNAEVRSGRLPMQWRWLMDTCIDIAVSPGNSQVRAAAIDVLACLMDYANDQGFAESDERQCIQAAIRQALADEQAAVRVEALKRLHRFVGPEDWQQLITISIRDPDRSVSLAALVEVAEVAGWYLRAPDLSIVEAVGEQLQHDDARVRVAAAEVFTGDQFDSWDVPYLVFQQLVLRAEHDGDERVRAKAIEALWRLKRSSSSAVACLIRCSKDPSALVQQQAIYSLRTETESTEAVRSVIRDAFHDEDESVRAEAMAEASELVDWPSELVPILLAGLADPSAAVRRNALWQLPWDANLFRDFHPYMETIRDLTASEDRDVSIAADRLLNLVIMYDPPLRE